MSEFTDKLSDIRLPPEKSRIPKEDGRYLLSDRRILIREGQKFTLIGHRDKKALKRLENLTTEQLKNKLSVPGYGGYTSEQLKNIPNEQLVRMLVPKPKMTFSLSWLCTSACPEARQLKKLIRQSEKI